MRASTGLYIEIRMKADMDLVWRLTQEPSLHQRWGLRFTRIEYLPKARDDDSQCFLYETRIGFGMAIRGTGESVAIRLSEDGAATSSLKFASEDRLSLISEGAGYWKYVPSSDGFRFLAWYDYRTRYGLVGQLADILFRPLIGWATAWSFDRLRLWAEDGIAPETSLRVSAVHAICRVTLASVWIWHGLVPKLLFRDADEQMMLSQAGLAERWLFMDRRRGNCVWTIGLGFVALAKYAPPADRDDVGGIGCCCYEVTRISLTRLQSRHSEPAGGYHVRSGLDCFGQAAFR